MQADDSKDHARCTQLLCIVLAAVVHVLRTCCRDVTLIYLKTLNSLSTLKALRTLIPEKPLLETLSTYQQSSATGQHMVDRPAPALTSSNHMY